MSGFVRFAEGVSGLQLSAGQRALCAVSFDGVEPAELEGEEREAARTLFGAIEEIPARARDVVVWKKGARVGGTLLGACRVVHAAITLPIQQLGPGERAYGIVVAPDLRLARQALRYVAGLFEKSPELHDLLETSASDAVTFRRPDGHVVTIECLPATRGGSALRGRSLLFAMLTECAFFRDESYAVNDVEVFKAIAPRILPGGQILVESTPWSESGLLFDLFTNNHGAPSTAIAAHAPTLLMRDTPQIRSIVERERERDPDNALREFDALFISGGAHAFFDARAIVDATDQNLRLPVARDPQARVFVGVDWGFVADSTAAVVVQAIGKMLFVSEVLELRPTKGAPLVPSEAAKSVGDAVQRYRGSAIVSDRYYVDAMAEHLNKTGISVLGAPEGQNGKSLAYTVARSLLHEGRVRLPQHGRLLAQLRQVVGKATSGGHIAISSPRWRTGGHGDLVSALVNALWQANEGNLYSYVPPSLPIDTRRPYDDCMGSNEITIGADGQAYFTPPRQQGGIFPPGSGGGF